MLHLCAREMMFPTDDGRGQMLVGLTAVYSTNLRWKYS